MRYLPHTILVPVEILTEIIYNIIASAKFEV